MEPAPLPVVDDEKPACDRDLGAVVDVGEVEAPSHRHDPCVRDGVTSVMPAERSSVVRYGSQHLDGELWSSALASREARPDPRKYVEDRFDEACPVHRCVCLSRGGGTAVKREAS